MDSQGLYTVYTFNIEILAVRNSSQNYVPMFIPVSEPEPEHEPEPEPEKEAEEVEVSQI